MRGTSIEIMSLVFLLHFPAWGRGIFKVASSALKANTTKRIRLLGSDYLQDKELQAESGVAQLTSCLKNRKVERISGADDGSLTGETRVIPPGQVMERVFEVSAGSQVTWTFSIGASSEADAGTFGKVLNATAGESTELTFSVKFMPDPAESAVEGRVDAMQAMVDIVEPTDVDSSHSNLTGKTVVDRKGIVVVVWSNRGSWVRSRLLERFCIVVNHPDDDVGSFHSGDD